MVQRVFTYCDHCGKEADGPRKLRLALWFGINQGETKDLCSPECLTDYVANWAAKHPVPLKRDAA